ncbi:MAG: type II toxin-antitoxin system VapC family toxin [Bryobacteraceae bacterium]|nr:type II toxin-antitoxin system VapC family toxin [Bryobacteraceae bacterium]
MVAVDTNVVVRLLTGDHPGQAAAARLVFESGPVWIAKTVLLESRWVLERLYGFPERKIHEAFRSLLGLRGVSCEDSAAVERALALSSAGIDFADALHFTSRPIEAAFVSFDRKLVKRAVRAGIEAVIST